MLSCINRSGDENQCLYYRKKCTLKTVEVTMNDTRMSELREIRSQQTTTSQQSNTNIEERNKLINRINFPKTN